MIQPGMMFGGEGPIMQGTWYNPATGDAFTVRDSFFEDNQYVVTTTDGRYIKYDQLQNYIQSDMKLEDLKQMSKTAKNEAKKEVLPAEVSNLIDDTDNMMLPEDAALINGRNSIGNIYEQKPTSQNTSNEIYNFPGLTPEQIKNAKSAMENFESNMNNVIIEKALNSTTKPDFSISVEWDNYPEKEIEMLKDIMNITPEAIVDWYLDTIQFSEFIIKFKDAIKNRILHGTLSKAEESEEIEVFMVEDAVIETEEKPKKSKKSTTKKK